MIRKIKNTLYRSFENREISYKKLKDIVNRNIQTILLDVRSSQEFKEEHLKGAKNIPLYELEKRLNELPDKKQIIIIYCMSGYRSKEAKEKLEKLGYENIYNLKGGIESI